MNNIANCMARRIVMCIMLLGLASCYAPENIDVFYDDAAQGDTYQFDIMMLSEWAGHILPEKTSVTLYTDQSDYYGIESLSLRSDTLYYNGFILDDLDFVGEDFKRPLETLGNPKRTANGIAIHPFGFNRDVEVMCAYDASKNSEVLEKLNAKFDLSVRPYRCEYAVSGALALRRTWDLLKSNERDGSQVYVGNGDSFGVSQRASAMFNDLPTPEILSLIGFQVDTIGNHSFDNRVDYLQNIINFAEREVSKNELGYSYVATNLKNSSALSNWKPHYIATIPAADPSEEGLRVAFIGALDSTVFATTKTGSFGSINIDNEMCSIVNELELAYNENARAFFILGHILTGKESYAHLMDAIFTFTEPILSESIKPDGGADLHFLAGCESKIVVPIERIENTFNVKTLSKLNFKDPAVKEKYARLVDDIRLEIFSGIIGVIGEAVETPTAIAYYHEDHDVSQGVPGVIWNGKASADPSKLDLAANNLFDASRNGCDDTRLFDGHPCYAIELKKSKSVYDHPIFYLQIPGKGLDTVRLAVTAHKNNSVDNGHKVAAAYDLNVDKIDLYPVVSSLNDAQLKLDYSTVDLISPSYSECKLFMDNEITGILPDESCTSCTDFYSAMAESQTTYTTVTDMKTASGGTTDINYQDTFYACHNGFASYVLNEDAPKKLSKNLNRALAFWACLYSASSNILCSGTNKTDKQFHSPVVFEFKNYQYSTMFYDRSQTTYNTNIISNGFMNYMEYKGSSEGQKFDVSIINAGTLRDGDLSVITINNLPLMIPYDNILVSAPLSAKQIVSMIESALQTSFENQNTDYGGFPSVSRLAVAYKRTKGASGKEQTVVTEVWRTDAYGALVELLYLASVDEKFFARYRYDAQTQSIKVEFPAADTPWLCLSQAQYKDCSNLSGGLDFVMNMEDGHYYSGASLVMLSHSFLATGGDNYPNNFGLPNASQLTYHETSFRSAVYSYYSGTDSSLAEDGSISVDEACIQRESFETIDGLSPEKMDCMLYFNHFYDIADSGKRRWILSASEEMIQYLDDLCQASKLGSNL
ncbi:MAG: hypothetical protein IKY83_04845 [Proteobacteria bacterium]|nr:hypothetical protein [Pseudomonadota bacterium]